MGPAPAWSDREPLRTSASSSPVSDSLHASVPRKRNQEGPFITYVDFARKIPRFPGLEAGSCDPVRGRKICEMIRLTISESDQIFIEDFNFHINIDTFNDTMHIRQLRDLNCVESYFYSLQIEISLN